jgi:hypothetical protein
MITQWSVQCFSRADKTFFNKQLALDTASLDPITRSRVEMCLEDRTSQEREILKYRHLFTEGRLSLAGNEVRHDAYHSFGILDYIEDEDGKEITRTECARIQSGNDNVVAIPRGFRPHDIELYFLSHNSPVPDKPEDRIHLSQADIDTLAYFIKDVAELKENAFYSTSPVLHAVAGVYTISTLPVEHIVSFLTIFRRLYMTKERGNYNNACAVYARHYLNKRLTNWVTAERRLYNKFLAAKTKVIFANGEKSFTNRVLIDTMLTMRFAHQPKDDLRQQYEICLREAGDLLRLEFMFYRVIQEAAFYYTRAYGFISNELDWYLKRTGRSPTFDFAPYRNEMGRGEQLTAEERREESLRRHAEKAGRELWEQAGCPEGQLKRFIREAEERLGMTDIQPGEP